MPRVRRSGDICPVGGLEMSREENEVDTKQAREVPYAIREGEGEQSGNMAGQYYAEAVVRMDTGDSPEPVTLTICLSGLSDAEREEEAERRLGGVVRAYGIGGGVCREDDI